ncbi:MAG: S-layer family protein, partial [Pyrinomonadaceae bacterium]|nr:S-layer family protein [Pyrinomonadaceae bacterium]
VLNASRTFVSNDSVINADALSNGNGGRVIVWADEVTGFYGNITVRGGSNAGDGGFVEVSGKESLQFVGSVDRLAPFGQAGTLLLDPKNILIQAGGTDPVAGNNFFNNNPTGTSTISGDTLSSAIDLGSVTLQANNDITINDNVTGTTSFNGLTLQAGRSIFINSTINLFRGNFSATINDQTANLAYRDVGAAQFTMGNNSQIITGGGDITVTTGTATPTLATINIASDDLLYAGSPDTSGINSGKISLTATGDINAAGVTLRANAGYGDANAGDIILVSQAGSINVGTLDTAVFFNGNGGEISLSAQNDITTGELGSYGDVAGSITLTAGGNITIGDDVASVGRNGNGSNLTLNAGSGNITLSGSIIDTSSETNAGGNVTLNGNVTLTSSALTIRTTGGTSSGNITFNNQLDGTTPGTQNLTLNPGTGTITFNGIGNSVPLGNLTLDGTGILQLAGNYTFPNSYSFNNPINLIGNTTINSGNSGNTLAFNNTLAAGANNLVLSANTINFASTVSSTGNLTLNAANSVTQTGAISANGLELLGAGTYTLANPANDITTLAGNTTGAISFQDSNGFNIGTVNTTAGITTSSNLTLNAGGAVTQTEKISANGLELLNNGSYTLTNPANTISTLAGNTTGSINYSNSNSLAVGTVSTTTGITTNGGNIALTSLFGDINASAGTLNSSSSSGNGGATTLTAPGDINTSQINTQGNIDGGAVSLTSNNGAINTTETISTLGNIKGGDVTFTALGDINTDNIATAGVDGNGGNIILESTQGAINTTNNCDSSCALTSNTGNGTGGDITLKAATTITTGSLFSDSQFG